MLHEPAAPAEVDYATSYKMRTGVIMFIIYAIVYAGFVAVNVLSPISMEANVLFGLNLAVIYGFGLIVLALIMALIYNAMCMKKEKELKNEDNIKKEGK
ncbi:DUF485 domain-containing protein [candidate division KSB1 bacterium]|nr:DUF485 domain-containing protein [candidate division KSB1 bacterium]